MGNQVIVLIPVYQVPEQISFDQFKINVTTHFKLTDLLINKVIFLHHFIDFFTGFSDSLYFTKIR